MCGFFIPESAIKTIIAKEEVLLPDYIPTEAIYRTSEMETIADAINPMIQGRKCNNLFIYGPSGTGKTTCMKILIEQLDQSTSRVVPVYANCWEYNTRMAIYYKICEALEIILPRRGLAADEVFDRIVEIMRKNNTSVLVVLDELDSLIFNREDALLYVLSRASEQGKVNFGIIGISNKKDLTRLLDARTVSSLRFTSFEFKDYDKPQLVEILKERAKMALMPDSWSEEVLKECAKIGSENNGNARLAMEILWKAAMRAEKRDAKKVEVEDVKEVVKTMEQRPTKKTYATVSFEEFDLRVSDEEKIILDLLKEGEKPSSQVYKDFLEKKKKTKRQIRNYLMTLEAKGLIDSKEIDHGLNTFLKTKVYFLKKPEVG